jgi:hypothetical protein
VEERVVCQENNRENCPASNREGKYKLHSKDFLTNGLLLEDKRGKQYFKLMGKQEVGLGPNG